MSPSEGDTSRRVALFRFSAVVHDRRNDPCNITYKQRQRLQRDAEKDTGREFAYMRRVGKAEGFGREARQES